MKKIISNFFVLFIVFATNSIVYADSSDFIVLDVRTIEEYSSGHLKNTSNIDFLKADFKEQISKLDKSKTYKLYCRSGNRSGKALELMKNLGFSNLENLGSLKDAAKKLQRACDGPSGC